MDLHDAKFYRDEYETTPPQPERPTIEEFLLARLKESFLKYGGVNNVETYDYVRRLENMLVEVVEWHKNWPILVQTAPTFNQVLDPGLSPETFAFKVSQQLGWFTAENYYKKFGTDPPTAPLLRKLAQQYREHFDYNPEWDDE